MQESNQRQTGGEDEDGDEKNGKQTLLGGPAVEGRLSALVSQYRAVIETGMKAITSKSSRMMSSTYEEATSGGKRIRPVIALLVCEAVAGRYDNALPISVAYELAHSASLVQDDIIDRSPLRHAHPSIQGKYGFASAMLISDVLIFKIFEALAMYGEIDIPKKRLAKLLVYLASSAEQTAEGEFLEVTATSVKDLSEEEYKTIAGLKTGALFAGAAASGAVAGMASAKVEEGMHSFGYNLGMAFQIRDDILDVTGTSSQVGKPVMEDLRNHVSNIVIVHALSRTDQYTRNSLKALILKKLFGMTDVQRFRDILIQSKSIEYSETLAQGYAAVARDQLKLIPEGAAREKLELLTHILEFRRD